MELEDVIAGAMVPHRHRRGEVCEECVERIARAVRAWQPAPWPPPRPKFFDAA